jgi:hypothetical protein
MFRPQDFFIPGEIFEFFLFYALLKVTQNRYFGLNFREIKPFTPFAPDRNS